MAKNKNDEQSVASVPTTAPRLRQHYEDLPKKLERKQVDPRIPWLYNYKLDFRFK